MGIEPPTPGERVLPTLNEDGTRNWIRPKISRGRFYRRRLVTAWSLILLFVALPFVRLGGRPAILLDVPHREFTLLGTTFLPTDTFLLMLLLFGIFVGIFLVTAVFGRVWCGWACPQTVYMEYLFRPLETWIEGGRDRQMELDRLGGDARRTLKLIVFFLISAALSNVFLAYFVGTDRLAGWITSSPAEHPAAFTLMLGVTLLMFADFAWFREQTCLVACPYGRFQSVLLDRSSLIVGYDSRRGEPRATLRQAKQMDHAGDCVDCLRCVITCPTGIDIRNGLQMECIHCTQCIDACDDVMDRLGRPRGLIRYTSQEELETGKRRFLRPRLLLYSAILMIIFGTLGVSLAEKKTADVTLLRGLGAPFTRLASGEISSQVRLKVTNRAREERAFTFSVPPEAPVSLEAPENPLVVPAGGSRLTAVYLTAPAEAFTRGELEVTLHVADGVEFAEDIPLRLLGPKTGPGGGTP